MKGFLTKVKCGFKLKEDLPPPYEESAASNFSPEEENTSTDASNSQIIDLLAVCSIQDQVRESEIATEEAMGLKHSTPWSSRHRSKISLTWVLREQSEKYVPQERRLFYEDFRVKSNDKRPEDRISDTQSNVDQKWNRDSNVWNNGQVKKSRIVGRNTLYHDSHIVRPKTLPEVTKSEVTTMGRPAVCEVKGGRSETGSEVNSAGVGSERGRRRHRRRRKRAEVFGYQIKNLDGFLAEATIDRPGNIPVVLSCVSTLYQTREGMQREMPLPLGTVVNAVFKKQGWLYVQTPHADEGYVQYSACLPLGILPTDRANSPWHKTPCWESSTDIYPQPCGNMTDTEKEHLRGRTRSECGYRSKTKHSLKQTKSVCGEEQFDKLYLRATSVCSKKKLSDAESDGGKSQHKKYRCDTDDKATRHTLLVIGRDYSGCSSDRTLSVRRGEVVTLAHQASDVHADWYYVRKRSGAHGFIPADIAGHGYI